MNRIQCFDDHFSQVNTNFKNSFCDQAPTCLRWIVGDKCFRQHRKRTWHVLIKIKILLFQLFKVYKQLWAVFTSIRKLDCVRSGNKRKTVWRRKIQTQNWLKEEDTNTHKIKIKWCTQSVHHSFTNFQLGLGINFHILLAQKWLLASSLPALPLWYILFQIKLGLLTTTKLNLKKYLHPKHSGSTQSRGS